MANIDVAALRRWLGDGGEIAFIDVREEGQHGDGHPLLAVNAPYSRLELEVLDSRTIEEFNRFHVPGAVTCPGAELVHRFTDLVPDRDTLVVVSCAGRTRSIIGAQSLINAGVPNKVVSLQGGTQAWRLAGLELERDTRAALGSVSTAATAAARSLAESVATRYGVRRIDRATLAEWRRDDARTTY